MNRIKVYLTIFLVVCLVDIISAEKTPDKKEESKPTKKKKDIRDFNDADMERLFDEWEEDEEKDEDDLPEHLREPPKVDLSKIDPSDPESMVKMTKKGKTLMMFVSVSGNPTKEEAETITERWQNQLFQSNYQLQRYMVSDDRAIFMVTDGSTAFDIKNFLLDQERCLSVTIDQQEYFGRGSDKFVEPKKKSEKKDKKKKDKKKDKDKKNDKKKDSDKKKDKKKNKDAKKKKKEKSFEDNKLKSKDDKKRDENRILPDDSTKTNKAKKTEL
ncbi:LDLR chaperone boca-like [Anneissia japonica]|uniref:LDLR chaperone boca-like n=1 Tax=Anneissia japonica TaxID=1529436 RepID=UPI0014256703|nr:LDLR chaperone boca-like [Anneissia japonica]